MANKFATICCVTCGVLSGLAVMGVMIWLGVAALVPEDPFETRKISTGVLLIVFDVFAGFVGGIVIGCLAWLIFWPCGICCGDADCDCLA